MPDTSEFTTTPDAGAAAGKSAGTANASVADKNNLKAAELPDLTIGLNRALDLLDCRAKTAFDCCESSLRSTMYVSAAWIECGSHAARQRREIAGLAVNHFRTIGETAVQATGSMVDGWMKLNDQIAQATAARFGNAR
jgi:hypothetical protein